MGRAIGQGIWSVQVVGRGGSPFRVQADYSSITWTWPINNAHQVNIGLSETGRHGSACCEVFDNSEPWRDEIVLYRNSDQLAVGPLITVELNDEGGSMFGQGPFHWMEQRFLPDLHADGDAGDVFLAVFDAAYETDDSPNITVSARQSGVQTTQDFREDQFQRAADALRDLATYGVDFTEIGRNIVAGGMEVFMSDTPLLIHDDGVVKASLTKEGQSLATDVAVFGTSPEAGGSPFTGRATTGTDLYGLIQRSFTQLLVHDNSAADAAALARLESMQPSPLRLNVTLSDNAAFEYGELFPGRQVDVRLAERIGCGRLVDSMRIQQVTTNVRSSDSGYEETVELDIVPMGVSSDS